MRRILLTVACWTLGAAESGWAQQCPDGTPPPCDAPRRPAPARPAPPPPDVRARQIMLLPFRNVTRAPANDWLVAGAPLMLGEALGQFSDLTVVPDQRLTAAMRRLSLASDVLPDATQQRRLAEETGGWTAITGNVIASGDKLRITAQAFDVVTATVVTTARTEVAANADIREGFDRLTVQLLRAVGIGGAASDLGALTTRSVDAYRSYAEGTSLAQHGAFKRAVVALTDAVRRDSSFALAWTNLALASVQAGGVTEMLNPMGNASRAAEQAFRHSDRLPPRRAALMKVLQETFHAEFGHAHQLADSLVATDADDIQARTWLAIVEMLDSRLDTTTSPVTRKGSLNRSIEMAKGVLERDPTRLEMYFMPATIYGFGSGFLRYVIGGRRKEVSSLAAEFLLPKDVWFEVVLRDSLVLVIDTTFDRWPAEEQAGARLRAATTGAAWVNRWFIANPSDPEAHLWSSRFEEALGHYTRALAELETAVALKPESNLENLRARRMSLLELTGQFKGAEALADSIVAEGGVRSPPYHAGIDRSRLYTTAIYLRSKQWEKAAGLAKTFGVPAGHPACEALATQLRGTVSPLAPAELRAVADTVAAHRDELLRLSDLAPCATDLSKR